MDHTNLINKKKKKIGVSSRFVIFISDTKKDKISGNWNWGKEKKKKTDISQVKSAARTLPIWCQVHFSSNASHWKLNVPQRDTQNLALLPTLAYQILCLVCTVSDLIYEIFPCSSHFHNANLYWCWCATIKAQGFKDVIRVWLQHMTSAFNYSLQVQI